MRGYGKVQTSFWTSEDVQALSTDGKLLALYLITGPHTNMIGCFRCPSAYVAADLNWEAERVSKGFEELFQKGFLTRDDRTQWVVIHNFLKWNEIENPNQGKAVAKAFQQVPDQSPVKRVLALALCQHATFFPERFLEGLETLLKGFDKPFRNQEQEQEQNKRPNPPNAGEGDPVPVAENPPAPENTPAPRIRDSVSSDHEEKFLMHTKWQPSPEIHDMALCAGLATSVPDEFNAALAEFRAHWLTMPFLRTQAEWDKALIKSLKADKARPIIPKTTNVIRHPRTGLNLQVHEFDDVDYHRGCDDDGSF